MYSRAILVFKLLALFLTGAYILANLTPEPRLYGIMVSRETHWVIRAWLEIHVSEFEKVVILDGSTSATASQYIGKIAQAYPNVLYVHEGSVKITGKKTDNGLRGIAWSFLNVSEVLGSWVVIVHPDEFYPQRFADVAIAADSLKANAVAFNIWYAGKKIYPSYYSD